MGLMAILPKPNLLKANKEQKIFPYLLWERAIDKVNEVWSSNRIWYVATIMDWHSRYALSWRLSNTLDTSFCLEAFDESFKKYEHP